MKVLRPQLIGRFGNQMMIYAGVRGLAASQGHGFESGDWIGTWIFDLNETIHENGVLREQVGGYFQDQDSIRYTRAQFRDWFRIKPEIAQRLDGVGNNEDLAHHRAGDYADLGYPVVSRKSYVDAARTHCVFDLQFVCEEHPTLHEPFAGDLSFLPDFFRLTRSKVLFRGNSSFSWCAAMLSDAEVFSPRIDELEGGREHHCMFERGNHCRFANLDFVTDLHIRDE